MNKSVEQSAPAARNVRMVWVILAAVVGLMFLVELFSWSKGKANIRSVLLLAGVELLLISNAAEQGALRWVLRITGFALGVLGASLMILHWVG